MLAAAAAAILGTLLMAAAPAPTAAPLAEAICNLQVQYPHASSHVNGTINVVSTIDCPFPAKEIYMRTTLVRTSDSVQWPGTPQDVAGPISHVQSNAAAPCSAGPATFKGYGYATVYPPAGYTPSIVSKGIWGGSLGVICGGAQ